MSSMTGHIDFGQSAPRHDAPPAEVFGRASTPGDGYPLAKPDGKPYVMARAGEVFGPESILVDSRPQQAGHTASLCSGEAFQISVLLLSTAYLTMLLRSSHHMHTVVRSIFRSGGVDRNIVDECGNASSARFMTSVGLFGIALAALAAVRIVDMLLPQQTIVALPAGIDLAPAVAIAAGGSSRMAARPAQGRRLGMRQRRYVDTRTDIAALFRGRSSCGLSAAGTRAAELRHIVVDLDYTVAFGHNITVIAIPQRDFYVLYRQKNSYFVLVFVPLQCHSVAAEFRLHSRGKALRPERGEDPQPRPTSEVTS